MTLFAGNTTVYIEIDNHNDTSEILNDDLENIREWADQWLIKCSPSKQKVMTCSFRKKHYHPIICNNIMLQSVDTHKHLVLTISSNLTWTSHIYCIVNSVSAMCDVTKKARNEHTFHCSDQHSNMHHIFGKIAAKKIQINMNIFNLCWYTQLV